jgi:hypothetical protein
MLKKKAKKQLPTENLFTSIHQNSSRPIENTLISIPNSKSANQQKTHQPMGNKSTNLPTQNPPADGKEIRQPFRTPKGQQRKTTPPVLKNNH